LQLEPGELGHQVELGRPDVAARAAEETGFVPVTEPEMMRDDLLVQHVVGVEADVARLALPHGGLLPWRQLA
jgi:hypothetical protein